MFVTAAHRGWHRGVPRGRGLDPLDRPDCPGPGGFVLWASRPCAEHAGPTGVSQSFWRLPRVEAAGGMSTSELEVADDPERDCREAEAPVEGRFQGPALRGD